jgi:hypothetical protein
VVVSALDAKRKRASCLGAGGGEEAWRKVLVEEQVGTALVDHNPGDACAVLDKSDGVMPAPFRTVRAKIEAEPLFASWYLSRPDDGREDENRAIAMRDGERAAATHRVTAAVLPGCIDG